MGIVSVEGHLKPLREPHLQALSDDVLNLELIT